VCSPSLGATDRGAHGVPWKSAGVATIEAIEEEGLLARVAGRGTWLGERLRALAAEFPFVGDVRGLGYMWGLEFVADPATAEPPVCRVMDFGKYLFEVNKKQQVARKKQKQIQVKEVKFRPGTGEGDYQIKLRNLIRFLTEGDKAKVTLRFRGREMVHQDIGRRLLERVSADLGPHAVIEQNPLMEGKQMVMVFAPKKK